MCDIHYYLCALKSVETVQMCKLVRAIPARRYDKYQNLMCWLIGYKTMQKYPIGSVALNVSNLSFLMYALQHDLFAFKK